MSTKELIIFDFDYTLARTIESIWVWSPRGTRQSEGRKYIPTHPSILSKTKLGNDESINDDSFKEFYSLDIKNAQSIDITFKLLDYYLLNIDKYDVYILTARPEEAKENIITFFNNNGLNTQNLQYIGLKHSSPVVKIDRIQEIISKEKYKHMSIYEDNKYIIENICKNVNIKVKRYYIQSYGKELRVSCYE
jgi:hypothetical protein